MASYYYINSSVLYCLFVHPGGDALAHALLEGGVAALPRKLLGDDGLVCSGKLAVAGYEVSDTKVVDVFIVAGALTGEILAEIVAVHTHGCRELRQGQVRLQVELCFLAVLRQQLADMGSRALGGGVLCFTAWLSMLRSFNVSTRHSRRPASGNPARWAMVDIT